MVWISRLQHACHSIWFILFIIQFQIRTGGLRFGHSELDQKDPFTEHGLIGATLLYLIRFLPLIQLPFCVLNLFGLILYNAFPGRAVLKYPISSAPFICFRVVTRGDCPSFVLETVRKNLSVCHKVGLQRFLIQIVTQNPFSIPQEPHVQQILVPNSYRTKSGSLYRSRSMHYCLEKGVNKLAPDDWIVHLDEGTCITEESVRGIINFCTDGIHPFGQGVMIRIPYKLLDWLTVFFNSHRVAEDFGRLRLQHQWFHRAVFGFHGTYLVGRVREEIQVGFDNGLAGSLCDDMTFAMLTCLEGYTSGFIDGYMYEIPPINIKEHILQRRRWFRGLMAAITQKGIPFCLKAPHFITFFSWGLLTPIYMVNVWLPHNLSLPYHWFLDFLLSFVNGVNTYMFFFGAIKQFSTSLPLLVINAIGFAICVEYLMKINLYIEAIVVILGVIAILKNDNRWDVTRRAFKEPKYQKK